MLRDLGFAALTTVGCGVVMTRGGGSGMRGMKVFFYALVALLALGAAPQASEDPESLNWTGCGITRKAFMNELADAYKEVSGVEIALSGGGATRGIREVGKKGTDLGGSCRHTLPFTEEDSTIAIPIAWDALCIVVHKDNPINNITRAQLEGILSGKITDWSELGNSENYGPITVHARESKVSGVGYMGRTMIFADADREFKTDVKHPSSGPLEKAVGSDLQGIGLSGYSSAKRRENLKILAFDGTSLSADTIRDGSYGLARPLFLTVHKDYKNDPVVRDFVAWSRAEDGGQHVIRSTGSVPVIDATDAIWERYFAHMSLARQDTDALRRIMSDLLSEGPSEEPEQHAELIHGASSGGSN